MLNYFDKRGEKPVEERNYGSLWFWISVALFVTTLAAIVNETFTRRPWKSFQKNYYSLLIKQTKKKLAETNQELKEKQGLIEELRTRIRDSEKQMENPDYRKKEHELVKLEAKILEVTREFRFTKATSDEEYYYWKTSQHEGKENIKRKLKVQKLETRMSSLLNEIGQLEAQKASLNNELKIPRNEVKAAQEKLNEIFTEKQKWEDKIKATGSKGYKVEQVVIENYDINNFDQQTPRVDRCMSCHKGVSDPLLEGQKQPFTYHSNQELFAKHNWEKFGCTPCHGGQGRALSSVGDAHGTSDPYWQKPLLPLDLTSGYCFPCHNRMIDFPLPPTDEFARQHENNPIRLMNYQAKVTLGKKLVMDMGCVGCHDIPLNEPIIKVGPVLTPIAKKVTGPEWVYRWLKNPKEFHHNTRMPNFILPDEEVKSIAAYLWSISNSPDIFYQPAERVRDSGSPTRGKQIVATVGCYGCHAAGDWKPFDRLKEGNSFGPELNHLSSKVKKDWLKDWVRNPKRYRADTKMPNMRLTDQEAEDVVAYLWSLSEPEADKPAPVNLDDVLNNPDRIKEGKNLIRTNGCFGCHEIKGMETEGKVSVPLTTFGDKTVEELFYGDVKIPHDERSWRDWTLRKMKNTRVFQTERVIQRMPNFEFTDEEALALVTLLKSWSRDVPPEVWQYPHSSERQQDLDSGRYFVRDRNCIGCHQLEGKGRYIAESLDDIGLAPPILDGEGEKVQYDWLFQFLKNPSIIRPWFTIRMPSFEFTDRELETVMKYFSAQAAVNYQFQTVTSPVSAHNEISEGAALFRNLQCQQCHIVGGRIPDKPASQLAPNLATAHTRLHPDWIVKWLTNPSQLMPGTGMPQFWDDTYQGPKGETSIYPNLDGNREAQIRALRNYLWSLR